MDGSITSFVGIDVAKDSLDLCILSGETRQKLSYDATGLQQLLRLLPAAGTCLIVVEATGGYQRRVVAQLADAGHLVAVANPRLRGENKVTTNPHKSDESLHRMPASHALSSISRGHCW